MARKIFAIRPTNDLQDLIVQLNSLFDDLTTILQRIEGFDGTTSTFFGDVTHTGDQIGVFSKTKATQAPLVADAETAHSTATTSDLDALGVVINNIIDAVQRNGWMADA